MDYSSYLEKAGVAVNALEATGAIQTGEFSSMAEFVDNSYDARANMLHIDYFQRVVEEKYVRTLEFLDDGVGMSREEALNVIVFGHSEKSSAHIGRFGIGLKSGAFYLGRELCLVTKKNGFSTIVFISKKFHEENKIECKIFVPCPSFDQYRRPFFAYSAPPSEHQQKMDLDKHQLEKELIEKFAPYGVEELLDRIPTDSGTVVIIEGLRLSLVGVPTLDFSIKEDIQLPGLDVPHEHSLRKYLEILYLKPRMEIYLRGRKILPSKITQSWMAKYRADFPMKSFKDVFKRSVNEREAWINKMEHDATQLMVDIQELHSTPMEIGEHRRKSHEMRVKLETLRKNIGEAKKEKDLHAKSSTDSVTTLFIGVQTEDRANNGVHIYANNRLVEWGNKNASFFKSNKKSIGVSVYVDLDASTWLPDASKQNLKKEDMTSLLRKCNEATKEHFEYFQSYFIPKAFGVTGDELVEKFWNLLGYQDALVPQCPRVEVTDTNVLNLMKKECPLWFICSDCRRWKRDGQGCVNRDSQIITCKKFNGLRGCSETPENGDDEQFKMEKVTWKKIELQMQKEKDRAARLLSRAVAAAPSTSTPSTSTPSTSTLSTSLTNPISLQKNPATGRSGSSQVDGIQVVTKPMSHPPESARQSGRSTEAAAASAANSSRVMNGSDSDIDVIVIDSDQDVVDDDVVEVNPEDTNGADDQMDVEEEEEVQRHAPISQASRTIARVRKPTSSEKDEDEEDEVLPRRASKPQSSRSLAKVRRPSSSEEDEDEEEEVLPRRASKAQSRRSLAKVRRPSSSEEDEDEEEDVLPRRASKAQSSRSLAKVRRLASSEEDEDDEGEEGDEEEEESDAAPPPKKKFKGGNAMKKDRKNRFNGEVLENAINDLLAERHFPPIPKKGFFSLDLVTLFKQAREAIKEDKEQMETQLESVERNAEVVLNLLGRQPYSGINIDHRLPTMDRLHSVAQQFRDEKNKKKKKQPKKK